MAYFPFLARNQSVVSLSADGIFNFSGDTTLKRASAGTLAIGGGLVISGSTEVKNNSLWAHTAGGGIATVLRLGEIGSDPASAAWQVLTADDIGSTSIFFNAYRWGGNLYFTRQSPVGYVTGAVIGLGYNTGGTLQLYDSSSIQTVTIHGQGTSSFNGGAVTIGKTGVANATLDIAGSFTTTGVNTLYGNAYLAVLDGTQRVGIGLSKSTSANATLDVSGTIAFSGSVEGGGFNTGWMGSGYRLIDHDTLTGGRSYLEVDSLRVRGNLSAYTLTVNEIRATNGSLYVSDSAKVESISGNNVTFQNPTGSVAAPFMVNDLIMAQTYDNGVNHSIIRQVLATVTAINVGNAYTITVSYTSGQFQAGDGVVRIGNTTDLTRQGAIYLTSTDAGAPYMRVSDGVNSFSAFGTPSTNKAQIGRLSSVTDSVLGTLSGYGIYTQNAYLTGNANIVGTLAVGGGAGSGSSVGNTFYVGKVLTNLLTFSSEIMSTWSQNAPSGLIITDNAILSPDGTLNASHIQRTGSAVWPYIYDTTNTPAASSSFAYSVWAKGLNGGELLGLTIARWGDYAVIGTANAQYTLTTTWSRYEVTGTNNGINSSGQVYVIQSFDSPPTSNYYVWGAQLENSTQPSPYQKVDGTGTSTVSGYGSYGMWATQGGFGGTMQNPRVSLTTRGLQMGRGETAGGRITISDTTVASDFWFREAAILKGVELQWFQTQNAGHIVLGQMTSNGTTGVKTGYYGLQMMDFQNREYFALGGDTTTSGAVTVYNRIAGWIFDTGSLYKISTGYMGLTTSASAYVGGGQSFFVSASDSSGTSASLAFSSDGKIYGQGIYRRNNTDYLIEGSWLFGDGNGSDVTISGTTTLSTDMYYNNLTVNATLNTGGYRIFVRDTLTMGSAGIIQNDGGNGSNGTNGVVYASAQNTPLPGGAGGTAAAQGTLASSSAGQRGGDGGYNTGAGTATDAGNGVAGGNIIMAIDTTTAGAGGSGANGAGVTVSGNGKPGAGGGSYANVGKTALPHIDPHILITVRDVMGVLDTTYRIQNRPGGGSAGGGGAAQKNPTEFCDGGGGGGSGAVGGTVVVAARKIVATSGAKISAKGGNGGNGGNHAQSAACDAGQGGGGAGGSGGIIILITSTNMGFSTSVGTATQTQSNLILDTSGGTAGTKGTGTLPGATDGDAGANGNIIYRLV